MKLKTCKSALKRIKIKKNNLYRKKAYKSHLLKNKKSNRLRRLSIKSFINRFDIFKILKILPYIKLK